MELQVGVKIVLKNKDGKYLILLRSPQKYSNINGMWDIVGGRIEAGTPLLENLKREIFEETKLELKLEPKLIYAQDILRIPGKHVVRLTYTGETSGEPVLDNEHSDFKWLSLTELKNMEDMDIYFKEVLDKNILG